jgi:hypothetical protein
MFNRVSSLLQPTSHFVGGLPARTAAVLAMGLASLLPAATTPARAAIESCVHPRGLLSPLPPATTPDTASTSRSGCLSLRKWGDIDLEPQTDEKGSPRIKAVKLPEAFEADRDETARKPGLLPAPVLLRSQPIPFETFLDKLMHAESGGKPNAKNPRSTALGPFQFINSTFLSLVRRHFDKEVEGMTEKEILALRTDPSFSRRAVTVFTNENAEYLKSRGIEVTYPGLRIAHLLGPAGAAQALKAPPSTALPKVFSKAVLRANPFMAKLTVAGLVRRAERELGLSSRTDDTSIEAQGEPENGAGQRDTKPARKTAGRSRNGRVAERLGYGKTSTRACNARSACSKVAASKRKVRFAGN